MMESLRLTGSSVRSQIARVVCSLTIGFVPTLVIASDQIPGAKQKGPILLQGGIIHTVSGETIQAGSVLLVDGKIKEVGKSIAKPERATVIDLAGKHVYPGLIESSSQLGLVEIDSIRASIDTTETGRINSNVRTQVAFNPDSEAIPVARANGILLSLAVPSGQFINGRSSFMQLDGWTWEDMAVRPNIGMHVVWPRFAAPRGGRRGGGGGGGRGGPGGGNDAQKSLDELKQWIETARIYGEGRERDSSLPVDARLEGLLPIARGELPIIADAEDVQQIQSAIAFCKQNKLKLVIYGGMGAAECAPLLKSEQIPVIVAGVYRLPRNMKPYDEAYTLPSRLQEAGVTYCISGAGRFGASTVRNLPYHAATAVAFGLDRDHAVRSMTLTAAEILGVADRVGSLDAGKDATLFIADGDILEIETHVTQAFVQGRTVDLSNHHTELYKKYKTKYDRILQE